MTPHGRLVGLPHSSPLMKLAQRPKNRPTGAPMTAGELGVDAAMQDLSMHCAKDYRTRYTLFKLISECGLEDAYLGKMQF